MNRKTRWLFAAFVAALVLCPAAYGAPQAPVPLLTFCGMEEWAKEAARQPPASLLILINECEYGHKPLWVENREMIELLYADVGEIGANHLTLSFPETPSTGYLWSLRIEDPDVLALTDEGFVRRSDNDMPGGDGGSHSYTFAAKKPGTSELIFSLISHHDEVVETRRYAVVADEELRLIEQEQFHESEETSEPAKESNPSDLPDTSLGRDRDVIIDGSRVTLVLDENPSTGYLWSVRIGRPEILTLDGERYTPDDLSGMMDGAGGLHAYTFSAKAKGTTAVHFDLISHQDEITQKRKYLITVDEDLRVTEAKLDEAR